MVAPNLLPGRTFDQSKLNSKLMFYWRAQDRSLTTVGGDSTGTLVRASAGGLTEGRGHFRPNSTSNVRLVGPAADNLPRWGVTAAHEPYLLLEDTRTNAWSFSSQLNNAAWRKQRSSITPNAILAPDGRTAADKLVEDGSSNTTHYFEFQTGTGTITINTDQTFSFYVKAAERTWIEVKHSLDGAGQSWINLTTGVVGTKHADHTITITDANLPGWWRITLVVDSGSSTSGTFTIFLATGDVGSTYTGDGSSGFYLWGFQFEADQSFVSSHIVTAASAVTRATETLSFPFLAPPQAMTIYLTLKNWRDVGVGSLFHIGSATAATDPRLVLTVAGAGTVTATYDDGTTVATTGVLAAPGAGDDMEFLVTLTAAGVVDLAASTDGAAQVDVASAAGGALPSAWAGSLLYLNSAGTSDKGFNNIGALKIAAGILTLQEAREAL